MSAQYQFEVTEHFATSHTYYVTAATRQEAINKVLADDTDFVVRNDIFPTRPIGVRDARRLRLVPPAADEKGAGR